MDIFILIAVAILFPTISGVLCYFIKKSAFRKIAVIMTTIVMFITSGSLIYLFFQSGGMIEVNLEEIGLPINIGIIIKLAEFVLVGFMLYIGYKLKKPVVYLLVLLQAVPLFAFEFFGNIHEVETSFIIDYLSLIMILLVSIVGPVIVLYALGYMPGYEKSHKVAVSKQPQFFFILLMFLGAMNGLVMTNDLSWMYFFWEITTLCSFLLISHNGNEESIKNGFRALWINMLGGIGFVIAIILIADSTGTLAINEIIANANDLKGFLPLAIGFLCFAGFTKSAQFPFQSWLLGAMVAPTPVSALLHSSTMVKAGVYLVVRFAPTLQGTLLGSIVATVGGFTFVAASAIAISQRNGKRVLAYSTIANLGLIICCSGIGSYVAVSAAVLLMVFHALSKGLLFLCVGTIEHHIGSKDIEDMQGLMKKMPFTTIIAVIGMVSMLLPPFGVLLTKWLAIESAVNMPLVLVMIVLGSAFTVVFWSQWIGIMLTMSYKPKYNIEKLSIFIKSTLLFLLSGVILLSVFVSAFYNNFISPYLHNTQGFDKTMDISGDKGLWLSGNLGNLVGGFTPLYFFIILFILAMTIPYFLKRTKKEEIKPPYLCGENTDDERGIEFTTYGDTVDNSVVKNYYLTNLFGENNLTLVMNVLSGVIIVIMFGVVL